jgi:hypothetical protein
MGLILDTNSVRPGLTPAGHQRPFRELNAAEIVATADRLQARIQERFPDASLGKVCAELRHSIISIDELTQWIRRPHLGFRVLTACLALLLLAAIGGGMSKVHVRIRMESASELLQALEAGVNDMVFIGVGVFFLATWETRRKRARALQSLHQLRALAHIVDMHQLTKDPERVLGPPNDTQSSPKRVMNPFELTRYLDYCSEMLSLISKAAALHVQGFEDATTLSAVEQIEDLTNGLSRKIWQKIMILDRMIAPRASGSG